MPIDYDNYPPDWLSARRPRILKRADHRCEFCGVDNGAEMRSVELPLLLDGVACERRIWLSAPSDLARLSFLVPGGEFPVKVVRVVLTIAHLDHDPENHEVSDDRLMALCQYCHLHYDAMHRAGQASRSDEQLDFFSEL